MARYARLDVLGRILDTGLVPLFFGPDALLAARIVAACAAGGARAIEFTDRADRAWIVFRELIEVRDRDGLDVALGAGSIVDAPTAAMYIGLGADFVVGPTFEPDIARLCNRRRVIYLPGCATLTEIVAAETAGVEIVKLFPGETVGGPAFVRAILGPRPGTLLLPTGGVSPTEASIGDWFGAGVAAVGIGSRLIPTPPPADIDLAALEQLVRKVLAWIRDARGSRTPA